MSISKNAITVLILVANYAEKLDASTYITVEDDLGRCLLKLPIGSQSVVDAMTTSTPTPENPTREDG